VIRSLEVDPKRLGEKLEKTKDATREQGVDIIIEIFVKGYRLWHHFRNLVA
jgi:hypothetical protein